MLSLFFVIVVADAGCRCWDLQILHAILRWQSARTLAELDTGPWYNPSCLGSPRSSLAMSPGRKIALTCHRAENTLAGEFFFFLFFCLRSTRLSGWSGCVCVCVCVSMAQGKIK